MGTQQFANKSIACTIANCANHCANDSYCGIPAIEVGTHEQNPTVCECTDCQSFRLAPNS